MSEIENELSSNPEKQIINAKVHPKPERTGSRIKKSAITKKDQYRLFEVTYF